jgi:hypothetical protein
MKDLLLFQLLGEPELAAAAIAPLLEELARLAPKERFAHLGRLPRALAHPDARLRAAAVSALAGLRGLTAFRHLIAALDDAAPEVQAAAVSALRASVDTQPQRWAHALFHPSAAVRQAAVTDPLPDGTAAQALYLLADPATGDELRRRLEGPARGEEPSPGCPRATPGAVGAILDFVAQGLLAPASARWLLLELSWSDASRQLEHGPQRSAAEIEAVLVAAARPERPQADALPGVDLLDTLFALFGGDAGDAHGAFLRRLSGNVGQWSSALHGRVIASLLVEVCRRGAPTPEEAALLAVQHQGFPTFAWIDRAVRRKALDAIYAHGRGLMKLDEAQVRALLADEICRRPSGRLDLRVVGALLHRLPNHPYHRLLRWFGVEEIVAAFLEDVEDAAPFLSLPDDSKRGRAFILERTLRAQPLQRGLIIALLALSSHPGDEELLASASPEEAVEATRELLRLVARPGHEAPPKKLGAIAAALGPRLAATPVPLRAFLERWLSLHAPEAQPLGMALLGAIGLASSAEHFVAAAISLDADKLARLLVACAACTTLPYGKEVALAHALRAHADAAVRCWAEERIPPEGAVVPAARNDRPPRAERIPPSLHAALVDALPADLPRLLRPCLDASTWGLCEALAMRAAPASDVTVATALLGSFDRLEAVDAQFRRYGAEEPAFLSALDAAMVKAWLSSARLPLLGHAWLHCWEAHAFAAMEILCSGTGLADGLTRAAALGSPLLRLQLWGAAASVMAMWRWRSRDRLATIADDALGDLLVSKLDGELGDAAAQCLAALVASGVAAPLAERLRPLVEARLPDLAESTRRILAAWVEARGLAGRIAPRVGAQSAEQSLMERARSSRDLDELITLCAHEDERLAQEAMLRALELGEPAAARLLALLREGPPSFPTLIQGVPLWPAGPSREALRALPADTALAPELRFRLALVLVAEGDQAQRPHALAAARVPEREPWFARADWDQLLRLGETPRSLALALCTSPHPHAYQLAVEHLLRAREPGQPIVDALRAFLLVDSARLLSLRRRVSRHLHALGDALGFPLILEEKLESGSGHLGPPALDGAPPERVALAATTVLLAGEALAPPRPAFEIFSSTHVDPDAKDAAIARFIAEGGEQLRRFALGAVAHGSSRAQKIRAIAEAFAWGVRVGRTLTGRLFRVQMITGKGLGYTRLDEDRLFISPLPLLLGAAHGREIVEGLILHELGHHLHHRGEAEAKVWKQAEDQGIHGLLNLVADEHLERKLRAVEASFGDRLKRLAAHAFQHTEREVPVAALLEGLGSRAFAVLSSTPLGLARAPQSVRVESGALLFEMERCGLSFSRFFRALRMGLGNRHDDPKVAAGLALFKSAFRKRPMPDLLTNAHELRVIFGWETRLVEHFGPLESLEDGDEIEAHGEGITQAEIDAEVERVLDPRRGGEGGAARKGGKSWINVSPDEHFQPITRVIKVLGNPVEHRRYAEQVRRPAAQMRRYFEQLGLAFEPQRFRLQGRRFDRSRTLAVVVRGDPRMLIARELRVRTDLFLGVIIDCSGSMQTRGNIEKARLFGTMLSEAIRDLPGVDLRILGFTDHVIYDAGDARRPAAHALVAGGGNNDAAALWHGAKLALASRRKARLLVMVSDGLPTECSTAALRALVKRLGSRLGICCAQVAVQPLAEVCFPHYVVLEGGDAGAAVHRFGKVIADLVQKAMRLA